MRGLVILPALLFASTSHAAHERKLIMGGEPVTSNIYPSFGRLLLVNTEQGNSRMDICGSTLISSKHILTAGHCVSEDNGSLTPASKLGVVLNDIMLFSPDGKEVSRAVVKVTRHPSYNWAKRSGDLAVLELASPVNLTPSPISSKAALVGQVTRVIGFGMQYDWGPADTKYSCEACGISCPEEKFCTVGYTSCSETVCNYPVQPFTGQLHQVDILVMDSAKCANAYNTMYDDQNMMCAGAPGRDSCNMDAGGPLLASNGAIVGVVSYGKGSRCGNADFPRVYARVEAYYNWIQQQIGGETIPTAAPTEKAVTSSPTTSSPTTSSPTTSSPTTSSPTTSPTSSSLSTEAPTSPKVTGAPSIQGTPAPSAEENELTATYIGVGVGIVALCSLAYAFTKKKAPQNDKAVVGVPDF